MWVVRELLVLPDFSFQEVMLQRVDAPSSQWASFFPQKCDSCTRIICFTVMNAIVMLYISLMYVTYAGVYEVFVVTEITWIHTDVLHVFIYCSQNCVHLYIVTVKQQPVIYCMLFAVWHGMDWYVHSQTAKTGFSQPLADALNLVLRPFLRIECLSKAIHRYCLGVAFLCCRPAPPPGKK